MKNLTDEEINDSPATTGKETPVEKTEANKTGDSSEPVIVPEYKPAKKDNSLTILLFILLGLALAIYAWSKSKDKE